MKFAILILFAYLLGSIPFSYIIARLGKKDLRKIGSGNIGATNLSRAMGKKWGYICFLLDVSKGLVPMLIAGRLISTPPAKLEFLLWLIVGCAAIIGHVFPIYLNFKGGKGVATSFGISLGLWPYFTISVSIALIAWLIVLLIWRYISLASIVAAVAFPLALVGIIIVRESWQLADLWPLLIAATIIPLMVVLRHRSNISRIIAGTESKIFTMKS